MRRAFGLASLLGLSLAPLGACEPGPSGRTGVEPGDAEPSASASGETGGAPTAEPAKDSATEPANDLAGPTPEPIAYTPRPEDLFEPSQPLDDPSGTALDPFYAALAELDLGGKDRVRVTHIGDSSIGLDGLTKTLRSKMQERFGDGGPGFLLMARYTANYRPASVKFTAYAWRECYIAYGCKGDGRYGLGGVTFEARDGARTLIETRPPEPDEYVQGTHFGNVELWYAGRPHGGKLKVKVDGELKHEADASAEALTDRWESFKVEDGPHKLEIRGVGEKTRAYGVVLETDTPGLVWDAMSMIGSFTRRLNNWDGEHIAGQVEHRDPDLLVFSYGGNDLRRVVAQGLTHEKYIEEYREVLRKVRAGKPEAACLLVGVIDHGRSGSQTVKPKHVDVIIGAQRELAAQEGCAFFNSYDAMGGAGSMFRWRKQNPPLAEPDLKHLNPRGRVKMAGMMYEALMTGYVDYRQRLAAGKVEIRPAVTE